MMQHQQQPTAPTPLAANTVRTPLHYINGSTDDCRTCGCMSLSEKKGNSNNKENEAGKSQGLLAKMCSKLLRSGRSGGSRRAEKCEKCGERSATCRPNASFISGRKHFLCDSCRVSGHKMKNMYSQLSRNLSLRESAQSRSAASHDSSDKGSVVRSRSLRVKPPAPESGYETATSLDSSSCSNGRVSPDSLMSTDSAGHTTAPPHNDDHLQPAPPNSQCQESVCCAKADVFGGAFTSEMDHLQVLALKHKARPAGNKPRVFGRQKVVADKKENMDSKTRVGNYDGYLEIRAPNSNGVKYVFHEREEQEAECDSQPAHSSEKVCYRCHQHSPVAFRAPFQRGWLCEDCMDDLL